MLPAWSSGSCPCPWQGIAVGWPKPFCDAVMWFLYMLQCSGLGTNEQIFLVSSEGWRTWIRRGDPAALLEAAQKPLKDYSWRNVFLWDVFSLFPDTPLRSKFYCQEKTSKKNPTKNLWGVCRGAALLQLTDCRLRHWHLHRAESAPKDGTEDKARLVTAAGPFSDFEAFLEQHRHCCTYWEKQSCLTQVCSASCYNKGLKKTCSKCQWNNLHIYILPVRQLTYGLN